VGGEDAAGTRAYRRDRSSRQIPGRPHALHMVTAFADHAVWKFSLGPTSTTTPPGSALAAVSPAGSNVSAKSHSRTAAPLPTSPPSCSTLKHVSYATDTWPPKMSAAARTAAAGASAGRYHCRTAVVVGAAGAADAVGSVRLRWGDAARRDGANEAAPAATPGRDDRCGTREVARSATPAGWPAAATKACWPKQFRVIAEQMDVSHSWSAEAPSALPARRRDRARAS
jgi:hypothetical protein